MECFPISINHPSSTGNSKAAVSGPITQSRRLPEYHSMGPFSPNNMLSGAKRRAGRGGTLVRLKLDDGSKKHGVVSGGRGAGRFFLFCGGPRGLARGIRFLWFHNRTYGHA